MRTNSRRAGRRVFADAELRMMKLELIQFLSPVAGVGKQLEAQQKLNFFGAAGPIETFSVSILCAPWRELQFGRAKRPAPAGVIRQEQCAIRATDHVSRAPNGYSAD